MDEIQNSFGILFSKQEHDGKGNIMHVEMNSRGMVNATKMCQGFGKELKNFKDTDYMRAYLNALSRSAGFEADPLWYYDKTTTNENRATWVHEKVAMYLAMHISPEFALYAVDILMAYFKGTLTTEDSKAAAMALQQPPPMAASIQAMQDSITAMNRNIDAKLAGMVMVPAKKHRKVQRNKEADSLRCIVRAGMKDYAGNSKQVSSAAKATAELVQTSIEHFKEHMEEQFKPGMTWFNYGSGDNEWAIGHKEPVAAFDMADEQQRAACFHYTNLFPHWTVLNRQEKDKLPDGTLGRHKRAKTVSAEVPNEVQPVQDSTSAQPTQPVAAEQDKRGSLQKFLDSDKLEYHRNYTVPVKSLEQEYRTFCQEHGLQVEARTKYGEDMLQAAFKRRGGIVAVVVGQHVKGVDFAAAVMQRGEQAALEAKLKAPENSFQAYLESGELAFHRLAQVAVKDLREEYQKFCKRRGLKQEQWSTKLTHYAFQRITGEKPGVTLCPHDEKGINDNGVHVYKGLDFAERVQKQFTSANGDGDPFTNTARAIAAAAESASTRAAANAAVAHSNRSTDDLLNNNPELIEHLLNM